MLTLAALPWPPPTMAGWRLDAMLGGAALLAALAFTLLWRQYRLRDALAASRAQLAGERGLRDRAEQVLVETHTRLCRMAARQHGAREAERRRIGRDIHDDLGQQLLALKMDVDTLRAIPCDGGAALPPRLARLEQRIDLAVRSLRVVINDLRPAALEDGLGGALARQLDDFSRLSGIACVLQADGEALGAALACGAGTMLYRVMQEALANVARHAGASKVSVALSRRPRRLALTVSDNGVGWAAGHPSRRPPGHGCGLPGMRERVASAGGWMKVLSRPGRGTTVLICVPLAPAPGVA
ncbi:sensor histidine kinase [Rugamonas sp.]|uniref:sensor histidine kinase n=1 Tax=Rugamonas sp. TaxID=1926287 RepID=UPI0025EB508E|nr:sensor histidine kinase [Rugamonas sp.]